MNFLSGLHTSIKAFRQTNLRGRPSWHLRVCKIIMRINLAILLIIVTSMHLWATGRAQSVTLNLKNATLEEALKQIGRQTNYGYIFEGDKQTESKRLDLNLKSVSLSTALALCFSQQPYTYQLGDEIIVVRPKSKNILERTTEILKRLTITGKITDEQGSPLSGVTIMVKGSTEGTMTNQLGRYSINVSAGSTLVYSFMGYQTQEVIVNAQMEINLVLKVVIGQLDALTVVNTGFERLPKERATGSFATVDSQQLGRQITTNIIDRLEGVASAVVFNRDGLGRRQIRVRGQNTIFSNAEPLIVVDNFPYEGSMDNINPNDIENITILKDAAAASIWGVRAGNGVIVITTKKGLKNQGLKIGFNSNVTVGNKPDLYYDRAFLNSNDFINVEQQLFAAGFYTSAENAVAKTPLSPVVELLIKKRDNPSQAAAIDEQINALRSVDYRDGLNRYFYQTSVNQQYALNLSGGSDKMIYYVSGGMDINRGVTMGAGYKRYTFNSQTTYTPIKNLEFTAGLTYVQSINNTDNVYGQFPAFVDPYTQLADANGNALPIVNNYRTTYVNDAPNKGFLNWTFAPMDEFGKHTTKNNITENRLNAAAKYTILKGFSAEVRYQYQKQLSKNNTQAVSDSFYTRNLVNRYSSVNSLGAVTLNNIPPGDILIFSTSELAANNLRFQLNYNNTFGDHTISALSGYEIRDIKGTNTGGAFYGYDPNVATISKVNTTASFALQPNGSGAIPYSDGVNNTVNRYLSWYGNAAYTFKNRYTISGSGRVDGSNYFGVKTNQKFVPLWSIGSKWDLEKEEFYKISFIPKLSIRATYGYNGNLNQSLSAYTTANYTSAAPTTGLRYATITNPPNPQLRWERTRIVSLGLDFVLKNQIVSGSFEYFWRNGKDIIGDAELPPSTGVVALRGNFAQTTGSGFDLILNSNNLKGLFGWSTSLLFSRATDKVTSYDVVTSVQNLVNNGSSGLQIYPRTGYPVYGMYSYRWAGLDPINGDPQGYENGVLSKNYTSLINPANLEDVVYHGPAQPIYSGGLQNTFSYKQFTLSFQLNFKFGYFIRQNSLYYSFLFNNGQGYADFVNRWQNPGDEKFTNVPSMPALNINAANRDTFYNRSEVLVQKGDHVRFQDINFSYAIENSRLKKLGINMLSISLYARNLGVIWRANNLGLDPDLYTAGLYPIPTNYSLALRANF